MKPPASCVTTFHIWEGRGWILLRVAFGPLGFLGKGFGNVLSPPCHEPQGTTDGGLC